MLHLLYSQFVRARRRYYERRPGIRRRLTSPVISVGNLTVGGSGKTPLVAEIARMLIGMGERPAILSRGYARQRPSDGVVVVSDGKNILTGFAEAGDEPCMLARAVPGAAVVVCPSRYLAGRVAEERLGCTVHVLDDGFQHLSLMRDIDLLVADPDDFHDVRTLPFGRFREPLDAAGSADALFVPLAGPVTPAEMAERLLVKLAFGFERSIKSPVTAGPAFAFAGIAKPERFFADLEASGLKLAGRRSFPDHHAYSSKELDEIARSARESGAAVIVTTSKDAVRIPAGLPVIDVPLEISVEPAFRVWLQERLAGVQAGMRHRLEFLAVKVVELAVRPLPLRMVRALGEALGLMFYLVDRAHRRIALANLEGAFPARTAEEREQIARSMFMHFGRLLLELLKYASLPSEQKLAVVEWEGEDRVRLAYAQGKGILFCTGHFGFWEQQALAHALKFEPMAVMARPLDNPMLHDLLERMRVSNGNPVLYRRGAVRKALRLLAEGRGIGILIDQHMTSPDAIYVDFFGRPAATTSTLAALAIRTGAPVIPLFAFPLPDGRYRMIYEHPIEPPRLDSPDAIREFTQRCTDVLEMHVRRRPELWLWMHRRWRSESGAALDCAPGMFPSAKIESVSNDD